MDLGGVYGQQPRQGTKSCRMGRNSVRPSVRSSVHLSPPRPPGRPSGPSGRPSGPSGKSTGPSGKPSDPFDRPPSPSERLGPRMGDLASLDLVVAQQCNGWIFWQFFICYDLTLLWAFCSFVEPLLASQRPPRILNKYGVRIESLKTKDSSFFLHPIIIFSLILSYYLFYSFPF